MVARSEFEKEIKSIVDQLIQLYRPEKIILFGSLVDDVIHEGTDIDLFIIKDDVPVVGVDRVRQVEGLIHYSLATDFIVYRQDELQKRIDLQDPFVINILENGKVLYSAA